MGSPEPVLNVDFPDRTARVESYFAERIADVMENPYASPAIPADLAAEAMIPREIKIASQGKRFLNLIVDNIVIQILSTVVGFMFGIVYAVAKVSSGSAIAPHDEQRMQLIGFLLGLIVAVGYFVITESLFQRSLAKFLTGTLVVTADGRRPTLNQIVGRSFARLIPFEAFSFLGGNQPVGWHDSLSGTRVINAK